MSRCRLILRLVLCLVLLFTGCSLPIALDDDSFVVNGGVVSAPTTTQRANSLFVTAESSATEPTDLESADNSPTEPEDGTGESPSRRDLGPGVNFRPFIP